MSTIRELFEAVHTVKTKVDLWGATGEFNRRFQMLTQAVGQAIMEERGISDDEALQLPMETVLGPKAQAAFENFVAELLP